jgi:hypothetical protein
MLHCTEDLLVSFRPLVCALTFFRPIKSILERGNALSPFDKATLLVLLSVFTVKPVFLRLFGCLLSTHVSRSDPVFSEAVFKLGVGCDLRRLGAEIIHALIQSAD